MKCPECGQWNAASLPRCKFCGAPLEPDAGYYSAGSPDWQSQLKDTPQSYVLVDDSGEAESPAVTCP